MYFCPVKKIVKGPHKKTDKYKRRQVCQELTQNIKVSNVFRTVEKRCSKRFQRNLPNSKRLRNKK